MSARQRLRRREKKRHAKGPPPAVLRAAPPAPTEAPARTPDIFDLMTKEELLVDIKRRLWNIAEKQVAAIERRAGVVPDRGQRAPKTFAGGPLQPTPSPVVSAAKDRAGRTVRRPSRSCP